ncbi:MAG: 3-phosphoshikimate 1-carboxyvinyltransferase [Deltaproteobacteria bacterium]|nr:3-phosphoshikimate 1-carboxyvinyltransferase [Deltaproteobacteria bacterium]
MELRITGGLPLKGEVTAPADKSITHRALILSALADGDGRVTAPGAGVDNASTASVLRGLGVSVEGEAGAWLVRGGGPAGLRPPEAPLDCGNSGTTIRLMTGVLAGAGIEAELLGDASLKERPMGRVCAPLRELGAKVAGRRQDSRELPPVRVGRGAFQGGAARLSVASAQVKSALLLAGVASGRAVEVAEPALSRDHSERMLRAMGASIRTSAGAQAFTAALAAGTRLTARDWQVPGDFSSAAFLLAAGLIVPGSEVTVHDVGVNATRTGLLEICEELGAKVQVWRWREEGGEPVASLTSRASALCAVQPGEQPTVVGGDTIPRVIDELVVLAPLAAVATGRVEVRDARELRVKESDRVAATVALLAAFGVHAEESPDGYVVHGPHSFKPARVDVRGDHRIAMTAAVIALAAPGDSTLTGCESIAISYPGFVEALTQLGARIRVA